MLSSLLDADWLVACGSHGLGWYITKCHHDPAEWQHLDRSIAHAGVDRAHEALRARAHLVYGAFDYYAALHSEVLTVAGEPNIYSLTFNAFMAFVSRCGMVSRRCPHGDFEVPGPPGPLPGSPLQSLDSSASFLPYCLTITMQVEQ